MKQLTIAEGRKIVEHFDTYILIKNTKRLRDILSRVYEKVEVKKCTAGCGGDKVYLTTKRGKTVIICENQLWYKDGESFSCLGDGDEGFFNHLQNIPTAEEFLMHLPAFIHANY